MRVLICGGRDFTHKKMAFYVLDKISERLWDEDEHVEAIIHGAAPGADTIGRQWAEENDITAIAFHADWKQYGKAAGPIRNKRMLVEGKPNLVIAFPGGPGTAGMIKLARQAKVPVINFND